MNKLIDAKRFMLSQTKFSFQGKPVQIEIENVQPPPAFNIVPYKNNFRYDKLLNDSVNYLLLQDFAYSVIINKLKTETIKLVHGSNCVIEIDTLGTVVADNLTNCILIIKCHQLRVHNSAHCLFLVTTKSNVILENCKDLKLNTKAIVDDFDSLLQSGNPSHFTYTENDIDLHEVKGVLHSDHDLTSNDKRILNNLDTIVSSL